MCDIRKPQLTELSSTWIDRRSDKGTKLFMTDDSMFCCRHLNLRHQAEEAVDLHVQMTVGAMRRPLSDMKVKRQTNDKRAALFQKWEGTHGDSVGTGGGL